MRSTLQLATAFLIFTMHSCNSQPKLEDIQKFRATESFPEDSFLDTTTNKRALVVVAHDDDDCAMAGTLARLKSKGWQIQQCSFTKHIDPKTGKHPADIISNGNRAILTDGLYRLGLDTMKSPYLPIAREEFRNQFLYEKVDSALVNMIREFNPSVIFTLDDIKGGYGHPEHIFISELVKKQFEECRIAVQRIYQSVYTDHMEKTIVDTWLKKRLEKWGYPNASELANQMYSIDGMPPATTQVSILEQAETKMKYLLSYPEEVRKNLRKFIPYYEDFDAKTYFGVFDKEYFRVIVSH